MARIRIMKNGIGMSTPYANFDFLLQDIEILMEKHNDATKNYPGRPPREYDVFKRASLILLITGWETYIEDSLKLYFQHRLSSSKDPSDLKSAVIAAAADKMDSTKADPKILLHWTGTGWKSVTNEYFLKRVEALNTPDPKNIRSLSKTFLGFDITSHWRWQGSSSANTCRNLRDIIRIRGDLTHRSKELFTNKDSLRKKQLVDAINLVDRIVTLTEKTLLKKFSRQ